MELVIYSIYPILLPNERKITPALGSNASYLYLSASVICRLEVDEYLSRVSFNAFSEYFGDSYIISEWKNIFSKCPYLV